MKNNLAIILILMTPCAVFSTEDIDDTEVQETEKEVSAFYFGSSPGDRNSRSYIGLAGNNTFEVSQIKLYGGTDSNSISTITYIQGLARIPHYARDSYNYLGVGAGIYSVNGTTQNNGALLTFSLGAKLEIIEHVSFNSEFTFFGSPTFFGFEVINGNIFAFNFGLQVDF